MMKHAFRTSLKSADPPHYSQLTGYHCHCHNHTTGCLTTLDLEISTTVTAIAVTYIHAGSTSIPSAECFRIRSRYDANTGSGNQLCMFLVLLRASADILGLSGDNRYSVTMLNMYDRKLKLVHGNMFLAHLITNNLRRGFGKLKSQHEHRLCISMLPL